VAIFVCVCLGQEWIDSLVWFLVNHPVNILTLVYICESCAMSGTGQLCLNNVEIIFLCQETTNTVLSSTLSTFKTPLWLKSSFECCLYVYVEFLIRFKTNHVQIHKSTPLLSIFSLKQHYVVFSTYIIFFSKTLEMVHRLTIG